MSSSAIVSRPAPAQRVRVTADALIVDLTDGRTLTVPLAWYARLARGKPAERSKWRLIGRGHGINWPALDEDLRVDGLLAGQPSGESQSSLAKWLKSRGLRANAMHLSDSASRARERPASGAPLRPAGDRRRWVASNSEPLVVSTRHEITS